MIVSVVFGVDSRERPTLSSSKPFQTVRNKPEECMASPHNAGGATCVSRQSATVICLILAVIAPSVIAALNARSKSTAAT